MLLNARSLDAPAEGCHDRDVTLPTFLGIGAPKCGTSWLHDVLEAHPDVWVPARREVHYFDRYYDRGVRWYGGFFPPARHRDRYPAVGEITPHYLYHERGPERIAAMPSVRRLIVMVRNPVDRAYSHYWFRARIENYRGSFEEFLGERTEATNWGFYARHLANYTAHFAKERILVLVYEHLFTDVNHHLRTLGGFLGVDSSRFPALVSRRRVNPRFVPRLRRTYAYSFSAARWLVTRDLYGVVRWARNLGVMRLLGSRRDDSIDVPMKPATRERLKEQFLDDIERLETMFDLDLSVWKRPSADEVARDVTGSAS